MITEALPFILLQGLLFGTTLVASRFSVGQYAPTTYIWLRLVIASLGHLALYGFARKRFPWPKDRQTWKHATVLGVIGTALPMTAIVSSLQFQSSGVTSILITAGPALTVLLAHFFLPDEKLNALKGLGILLALGGALLLIVRGETGLATLERANPLGYLLVLVALLTSAITTIYARRAMRNENTLDVASIRMFTAALTVMPLSILFVGFDLSGVNQQGYLALTYAAIFGTFFGTWIGFFVIKRFGATPSSLVAYIIPIVAGFSGWLLLNEQITSGMLVGSALVLGGIALINRGSLAPRLKEETFKGSASS
jgi:drug/metabolite transporter (DMT)-like permease